MSVWPPEPAYRSTPGECRAPRARFRPRHCSSHQGEVAPSGRCCPAWALDTRRDPLRRRPRGHLRMADDIESLAGTSRSGTATAKTMPNDNSMTDLPVLEGGQPKLPLGMPKEGAVHLQASSRQNLACVGSSSPQEFLRSFLSLAAQHGGGLQRATTNRPMTRSSTRASLPRRLRSAGRCGPGQPAR